MHGLEKWIEAGGDPKKIASVASFLSAVSTQPWMNGSRNSQDKRAVPTWTALIGKTAIANATLAYEHYREILDSKEWNTLEKHGARPQKVLWASTSAKDLRIRIHIMLIIFSGRVRSTLCRKPLWNVVQGPWRSRPSFGAGPCSGEECLGGFESGRSEH